MSDEDLGRKLDRLCSLVALAFADQISHQAARIRSDLVAADILDRLETDWVPAAQLQEAVADAQKVSTRTVRSRIRELLSVGAIESQGAGRSTEYRSSGLI